MISIINVIMKLSIITVNYNDAGGLERTIKSVITQTFKDYEFIVIDGGSTDGSVDVIKKYEDHIDYWVSEPDGGVYSGMNKGVDRAHGLYCNFMNSGDSFYDTVTLDKIFRTNHEEDIFVGDAIFFHDGYLTDSRPSREISLYHLYSGALPHQASFIKTSLLQKYHYDEELKIVSDWKFFIQSIILDNCSFKYIDIIVAKYDNNGISSKNQMKMREEKNMVLGLFFPPRVLADYEYQKSSECLTQKLTPQLRKCYRIDKLLYFIGNTLIKMFGK